MTVDQWRSLISPSPDHASIILLAELILGVIHDVSEFLLKSIRSRNAPGLEGTMSTLHTDLSHTFSESLGLEDQADVVSLAELADLIQKETEEIVTSSITEEYTDNTYIIQPDRLNPIVNVTVGLFQKFGHKMKAAELRCKYWYQKKEVDQEMLLESSHSETEPADSPEDTSLPQYGSATELVQEVIRTDWLDISSRLLDNVTVGEYKRLQSESSTEIQSVADQIVTILSEKRKKPFQALRKRVKTFFAKSFLRVWLCRLLANVKRKHPQDSREESCELVTSIIDRLTPELRSAEATVPSSSYHMYDDIWKQSKVCISIMKWFMKAHTKTLCDRLHLHMLEPITHPIASEPPETDVPPKPSAASEVVKHAEEPAEYTEPKDAPPQVWAAPRDRNPVSLAEETYLKKTYISCFIDMVVFHVCNDAGVIIEEKPGFSQRIFERVWAEVEAEKMYVTHKSFQDLSGKIHKCICKQFKSLDLLYRMASLDPDIMDLIVSLVKERVMTPPKKKSLLSRLFAGAKRLFRGNTN
ncbi:unnamed protein product [Tetraodon nigroviridis]|uniref:(spotted green pufferfish) hypothetical protein n=1 Tax=Tetraodon nigroviridis TaxID=99883 RepID=Q4S3S8_TETNG|nr:unnamed protein product [Tetraodon nigroviridis]